MTYEDVCFFPWSRDQAEEAPVFFVRIDWRRHSAFNSTTLRRGEARLNFSNYLNVVHLFLFCIPTLDG